MSDFKLEIMQRLRDIEIKYSLPYVGKKTIVKKIGLVWNIEK